MSCLLILTVKQHLRCVIWGLGRLQLLISKQQVDLQSAQSVELELNVSRDKLELQDLTAASLQEQIRAKQ